MRQVLFPNDAGKIKMRARWIELLHYKKMGMRLLWRGVLMNLKIIRRKFRPLSTGKHLR